MGQRDEGQVRNAEFGVRAESANGKKIEIVFQ